MKKEYKLNTINIFDLVFFMLLYLKLTNQIQLDWVIVFAPICVSFFGYILMAILGLANGSKKNKINEDS